MSKQITLLIRNRLGLHARPAALFVQTANRFKSEIEVQKGKEKVNGKSIMGIMTLAAGRGSQITIRATGADAQKAALVPAT
jgi:phosphotransferase system HPr (HPr) family protein